MSRIIKIRNREELEAAFRIRNEVFVIEQGIEKREEFDKYDTASTHWLVYDDDDVPCGTARWRRTPFGIKIERMAILASFRNQGYGSELLDYLIHDLEKNPAVKKENIFLHAQEPSVKFYKNFGFEVEGEKFIECGIDHFKMVKKASA